MTYSMLRPINTAILAAAACLMLATPSQALTFLFVHPAAKSMPAQPPLEVKAARHAMQARGLPRGARALTGQELFELYVGKTWKWGEGGGYFGPHGKFRARTFGEDGPTDAGGTWGVNDKGRLCFRAVWTNSAGSSRANTCFDHMLLGGDIYQRKAPDSDWYVFRHGVPDGGDEYNKLVGENLVARLAAD